MFKFKMSLLLNNLKFRVTVALLLITAIVAGIIFIPKNKASNISNQVYIKAVVTGIEINGTPLYSLSKEGEANGYDNVFCIEQGQDLLNVEKYTGYKNLTEASNYFKNYNCAMWVINHMYISTIKGADGLSDENARDIAMLNFATAVTSDSVKQLVKSKVGVDYKDVTPQKVYNLRNKTTECSSKGSKRNVIELVEQVALWDYTKNKTSNFSEDYKNNVSQYLTGAQLTQDEQITLKYIYYALTNVANTMAKTSSTPIISNYITLNKKDVKYDESKNQFGPYYLEADGIKLTSYSFGEMKNAAFPVDAVITNKDGSTVKAGAEIFTKGSDGAFYINLSSYKDAKKVEFNINNIISKISTNGYVSDGGENQNILALEKTLTAMKLSDTQEIIIPDVPVEPEIPEGKYSVELVKTKKDGTTVITSSEATFKINGNEKTTTKGVLNIANGKNIENIDQKDEYEIVETKAPEGYNLYNGTIKLTVNFAQEGDKYVIDKDKTTATGLSGKARIEVSSDKTTVKIYVPNEEQETPKAPEGKYNVELVKTKKDGTTVITSSEATFKINGNEKTTTKGVLNIADSKTIENINQKDEYEIVETKAPEGYDLYKGTIKLTVNFAQEGNIYVIDKDKTTATGLSEKARIEVSSDKTTVKIYVPNEEKEVPKEPEGKYSVELVKTKEDGTTIITSSEATFKINGNEKTTTKGVLNIANGKNIENIDQKDEYEIVETKAPEGYDLYKGTIKLTVNFAQEGDKYVIDENRTTATGLNKKARIEVSPDKSTIKIYVPNQEKEKIFDLSLRKFISKINGKTVEPSRAPIINEQSIKMLEKTGTASYYHTKSSISVKIGDEIEYTIRVYNEGEILGYAKQITEYLPEGLSFVKISESSSKEYTTDSKVGSREIVLNYNGNKTIKTLRDFIGKEVKVTNEYYQEVKIICKVENTQKVYITNRSEITNYGYEAKSENGETIWKEAKEIGNVDRDSVQNTIKNNLGLDTWYENAKENTYVDENGKTVVDKNYYPGAQDDDDFETVELLTGKYNLIIRKVDSKDQNKKLEGAYFTVKGSNIKDELKIGPTNSNGEVAVVKNIQINNDKQTDEYTIRETVAPENYKLYDGEIKVKVATKLDGNNFIIDENATKVDGKDVKISFDENKTTITVIIPDEQKDFDLALRKFITEVNGKGLAESREPEVDVSKLVSGESTTATYNHSKTPVDVNTSDIVTYTIRVYNEGEIDGYATKVMDDIPEGLEFIPATYDANGKATNVNAEYKWTLYREMKQDENVSEENKITYKDKTYVVTDKVKEADLIVTDYLSKNSNVNNIIKAFDSNTMKVPDYKDVKVAFKVIEPKESDRIIINYAQITEHTDSNGNPVTDRDSTPNVWKDGDDDQDIEKIKVRYFDLSLLKWVSKAIVYENGNKIITETGHTGYENPEPVVKVDLQNTNINNVIVKFEYKIKVTNEGEIAGYAKEISDYIPEGLKFEKADNPQWSEKDGKIVTRALENTLLKPGQSAEVTVILTWINGEDNFGLKTNIAEISEDFNDYGTLDKDSTPNNKVQGEDDIDDAPVMLQIRTGKPLVYAGITAGVLTIIALGVFGIKKRVLR